MPCEDSWQETRSPCGTWIELAESRCDTFAQLVFAPLGKSIQTILGSAAAISATVDMASFSA